MDLTSEILRGVRLKGAVFVNARLTAPWSLAVSITADDCARFMPRPDGVIDYHVVIEGSAVVTADGLPPTRVHAGGVVLLPRNEPHILSSEVGLPPIPAASILQSVGADGAASIECGGGGEVTRLVCGFLAGATREEPLFAVLPRVLKAELRDSAAREWVAASARFAAAELAAGRLASSALMTHLSETLLVEAIREHCDETHAEATGWLRAVRDPQIGRTLAAVHRNPLERWTLDRLAREASLSRTAFLRRFTALMGQSPIAYVAAVRLNLAKSMLLDTPRSVAEIAFALSYGSEAAFSRAFKRSVGAAPSVWRRAEAGVH